MKGKDHGRIERREYFLTTDIEWIENREEWANLNAIGMVRSRRIVNGIESSDDRYFISSTTDIDTFSKAVRQHWEIEGGCLDLDFNEDRCRMRKDNSAENFAVIRHIALNLYKSFKNSKLSLKAKRFKCSFDDNFLCDIIYNKFS